MRRIIIKFIPGTVNFRLVDQNAGVRGGKQKFNGDSDSGTGGWGEPYFSLTCFQCKQQMSKLLKRWRNHDMVMIMNYDVSVYWFKQGVLLPLITLLGLVGNCLSIMVLHSPGVDMKVLNKDGGVYVDRWWLSISFWGEPIADICHHRHRRRWCTFWMR